MTLDQNDFEAIERLISKNSDDMAVAIARCFERLEEQITAVEARFYTGVAQIDGRMESVRQDIAEGIENLAREMRRPARSQSAKKMK